MRICAAEVGPDEVDAMSHTLITVPQLGSVSCLEVGSGWRHPDLAHGGEAFGKPVNPSLPLPVLSEYQQLPSPDHSLSVFL